MSATASRQAETFRDPAGTLYFEGSSVFRDVRSGFAQSAESFLQSSLARNAIRQGKLIPTWIHERHRDGTLTLEHEAVRVPTYPYEWSPGQWIAAGELTLDLCEQALECGLILKDATPLNILFRYAQPVFVDVLSFEPEQPGNPLWMAYGQFVRTFLLPLAAYKELGWPLSSSISRRDGYEPADLYSYLSRLEKWSFPLRSLVTLPHLLESRASAQNASRPRLLAEPAARHVLKRTLRGLRKNLHALTPAARDSRWSRYTTTADHYSANDHAQKSEFVGRALKHAAPLHVLDLGANTGHYSRIAAEAGADVVALDTDVQASDLNWRSAYEKNEPILPLVLDIARPSPAAGWCNSEQQSFLERASGRFDCVLMLGVLHHLLLIDQVPMEKIFEMLSRLTTRWLVLEWVPATDSQFIQLCRGRENLYGHLSEGQLSTAASIHFERHLEMRLANGRTLFLFERRNRSGVAA